MVHLEETIVPQLGGLHKGRPADPPEGGFGKSGQNRTWRGEGGFEVFGRPKLEKLYSLFSRYFCWKSYLRTKVFVTWQL